MDTQEVIDDLVEQIDSRLAEGDVLELIVRIVNQFPSLDLVEAKYIPDRDGIWKCWLNIREM